MTENSTANSTRDSSNENQSWNFSGQQQRRFDLVIRPDQQQRSVAMTSRCVPHLLENNPTGTGMLPNHHQSIAYFSTPKPSIQNTVAQESIKTTAVEVNVSNQGNNGAGTDIIPNNLVNERGNYNFVFKEHEQPPTTTTPVTAILVGSPQSVKVNSKPATNPRILTNEEILSLIEEESFLSNQSEITTPNAVGMTSDKTTQAVEINKSDAMKHTTDLVKWIRSGNQGEANMDTARSTTHRSVLRVIDSVEQTTAATIEHYDENPDWTEFLTKKPKRMDNPNMVQSVGSTILQTPSVSVNKVKNNCLISASTDRNSVVKSTSDPINARTNFHQPQVYHKCNPNICRQIIGTENWPSHHHHLPYNCDLNSRASNSAERKIAVKRNTVAGYRVPHIDLNVGRQYPTVETHKSSPINVVEVMYDGKEDNADEDHSRNNPNVTSTENVKNPYGGNAVVNGANAQQRIDVHEKEYQLNGQVDKPMEFQQKLINLNTFEKNTHISTNPTVNESGHTTLNSVQTTTGLTQFVNGRTAHMPYNPPHRVLGRRSFPKQNVRYDPYNYRSYNAYIIENVDYPRDQLQSAYYVDQSRPPPICFEPCPEVGPENRCNVPRAHARRSNKTQFIKIDPKTTARTKQSMVSSSELRRTASNAPTAFQQRRQPFNANGQMISSAPNYINTMKPHSTGNKSTQQATQTQYIMSTASTQIDNNDKAGEHVFKIPRLPKARKDKEPHVRRY